MGTLPSVIYPNGRCSACGHGLGEGCPNPDCERFGIKVGKDTVAQHIEDICTEAGLGVMEGIFTVIRDREQVTDEQLLALHSGDVTEWYEASLAPAIDSIEEDLRERYED